MLPQTRVRTSHSHPPHTACAHHQPHAHTLTPTRARAQVKTAMNEINAQKRLRSAANEKAEAEKIIQVPSWFMA